MDALLQNGDGLYQLVLNSLIEPAVIINNQGIIITVNDAWLDSPIHRGDRLEVYSGYSFWNLYEKDGELRDGTVQVLTAEKARFSQKINHDSQGGSHIFIIRATPLKVDPTDILGALIVFFDITDQKRLEKIFKSGAEQYRLIAEHSKDMIKVTNVYGKIEYASPSHEHILGYNDEIDIFENIHPDDLSSIEKGYRNILHTKESCELELRKKHNRGDWVWLGAVFSPVLSDDGNVQNIIVVSRDISERKQSEYELERMAYYDFLTGLYNRRKMRMMMEEALEEASGSGEKFAIIIMDLDKFKQINDNHGHDIGDIVLKEFSNRLLQNKGETGIVGRLSGDEFVVLMKLANGKSDIQHFIQRLHDALLEPCDIHHLDGKIQIKSSVGYSIYPDHGDTVRMLFKKADIALYKEKRKRIKVIKSDTTKYFRLNRGKWDTNN